MSNLIKFEGFNVEFLTKEDVNFYFEGNILFHGGQTSDLLNYSNSRKAIGDHVDEESKHLVKNSDVTNRDFRKLNNAGETFITEDGIIDLIYNSKLPKAKAFKKTVKRVIKQIQVTGRYDEVENQITQIEDETEKALRQKVYAFENVIKVTPSDMFAMVGLSTAKSELESYLSRVRLEEVNDKIDYLDSKVKKATVLREGDLSPEAVARKYNIFSINDNPHPKFAECLARELNLYIKPEGNAGYQDDYVSVNFTDRNGVTVPLLKYSKKAVELFDEYIEENGLKLDEPPKYFVRGSKKGSYDYTYMRFSQHDIAIKVNETTYKLYSKLK
ncbi:Bro-N domain-containing protein [Paenibacillus peoriae]|uniref:Bro-N domain-containing protein n=1 Tax=Paenibacillus peoriae TaxID=59893 RepID=A0A7H0Y2Z6_9BACL|nr:Bro-N domain-containing protein [Paenibacillus peoriae]QNR65454.1 Bro-N domain-containing protein [Paenibacillus peoriae]